LRKIKHYLSNAIFLVSLNWPLQPIIVNTRAYRNAPVVATIPRGDVMARRLLRIDEPTNFLAQVVVMVRVTRVVLGNS
jgi:hypothetical protein